MKVIDGPARQVAASVTADEIDNSINRALREVGTVFRPALPRPGLYRPEKSAALLEELLSRAEAYCINLASRYSPFRWLWYLRRLPPEVFEGKITSTFVHDSALADTVSRLSPASPETPRLEGDLVTFPIDQPTLRRVLRFAAAVRLLSQVQVLKRRCGKGAFLYIKTAGSFPQNRVDPHVEEAMTLYDQRAMTDRYALARAGTVIADEVDHPDGPDLLYLLLIHRIGQPKWMPIPNRAIKEWPRQIDVLVSFLPSMLSVAELSLLNNDPRLQGMSWWTTDAAAVLALTMLSPTLFLYLPHAFFTVTQFGYFIVADDLLRHIAEAHLPEINKIVGDVLPGATVPTDAGAFLRLLEGIPTSVRPWQYGSPIRRATTGVMVDLYAASEQLSVAFEFPNVQGEQVNARAQHFEDAVQRVIDRSPWRPSDSLRALRRRTLCAGGQQLSDLDAVGERGRTLLCLSCKSRVDSALYQEGDHRAVRNASAVVESAVERAKTITDALRHIQRGDNYDVSTYAEILFPVVTPMVVYTPIGPATSFIANGLRAAVSLSELAEYVGVCPRE